MTDQELKRRVEEIKASARETDERIRRHTAALELALLRLDLAVERLLASR